MNDEREQQLKAASNYLAQFMDSFIVLGFDEDGIPCELLHFPTRQSMYAVHDLAADYVGAERRATPVRMIMSPE